MRQCRPKNYAQWGFLGTPPIFHYFDNYGHFLCCLLDSNDYLHDFGTPGYIYAFFTQIVCFDASLRANLGCEGAVQPNSCYVSPLLKCNHFLISSY